MIDAQFGKDLFNISKIIGRKKVAQFFFWLTVYIKFERVSFKANFSLDAYSAGL